MKKVGPLVFAVLAFGAFTACKKTDRTCSCTVTKTGSVTTTAKVTFSVELPLPFPLPVPIPPVGLDTTFTSPVSESYTSDTKMEKVKKSTAKDNCYSYSEPYNETTYNIVPNFTMTSNNQGTITHKCELK